MRKYTPLYIATTLTFLTESALAQNTNGDWAKEGVSIIGDLEMGMGSIAVSLLGLAALLFGAFAVFTQRMDWEKGRTVIIGGAIAMVGPAMLKTLFGA